MKSLPPFEIDGTWVRIGVTHGDLIRLQSFLIHTAPVQNDSARGRSNPPAERKWGRIVLDSPLIAGWALLGAYRRGVRTLRSFDDLVDWLCQNGRQLLLDDFVRSRMVVHESDQSSGHDWFDAERDRFEASLPYAKSTHDLWNAAERFVEAENEDPSSVGCWLRLAALLQLVPHLCHLELAEDLSAHHGLSEQRASGNSHGARNWEPLPWADDIWQVLHDSCPREMVLATLKAMADESHRGEAVSHGQNEWSGDDDVDAWMIEGFPMLLAQQVALDESNQLFERRLHRAKLSSMKELAYGASHEINNPLANISTRAQTLLRDETDPERRQKLAMINSQAFRAHEMISNMMLFAHPPDLHLEDLNLADIIREAIDEMSDAAESQGIKIRFVSGMKQPETESVDESNWSVQADRTHLLVMFQALIRNSIEAMGQGGEISIRMMSQPPAELPLTVAEMENANWIEVADSGPGIPIEIREHIFDPFYSGREAGRGLGFGLSKAWRIATMHRGDILLDNSEGLGARFWIRLPTQPSESSSKAGNLL